VTNALAEGIVPQRRDVVTEMVKIADGTRLFRKNHGRLQEKSQPLRSITLQQRLEEPGIATPTGAKWSAMAVLRIPERLAV